MPGSATVVAVLLPKRLTRGRGGDILAQVEVQHTAKNCVVGKPFQKGADLRRNTRGRPRTFDALRELCQKICNERINLDDGEVITRLEVILRDWSTSKDLQKQIALVQYGYGKPPEKIEATGLEDKPTLILHYAHERPDLLQPDGPIIGVNGEGTRKPLLPDARLAARWCAFPS
jgi:hypothetical protein